MWPTAGLIYFTGFTHSLISLLHLHAPTIIKHIKQACRRVNKISQFGGYSLFFSSPPPLTLLQVKILQMWLKYKLQEWQQLLRRMWPTAQAQAAAQGDNWGWEARSPTCWTLYQSFWWCNDSRLPWFWTQTTHWKYTIATGSDRVGELL